MINRIPKITVGVPVYNGERYLEEVLTCLQRQTFEDIEIIICDNCSTDKTAEISRDYAARDRRILYVRNEKNLGAAGNYKRALELSRSPYFTWIAYDDLCEPTYLEECLAVLERDPGVVLSFTDCSTIDAEGAALPFDSAKGCYIYNPGGVEVPPDMTHVAESHDPVERFSQLAYHRYYGMHEYGLKRRDVLWKVLGDQPYSERPMLAELALHGRFVTLDKRLYRRRIHPDASCFLPFGERLKFLYADQGAPRRFTSFVKVLMRPAGLTLWQRAQCLGHLIAHTVSDRLPAAWRKEIPAGGRHAMYRN